MTEWTAERSDIAVAMWERGWSASEIALELRGVSRSAVIGRLHRLGKTRSYAPGNVNKPTPRPRKPRQPRKPKQNHSNAPATPAQHKAARANFVAAAESTELPADVSPVACTLEELDNTRCRWPMGDPGTEAFRFCGAPPLSTGPYCSRHADLAFTPARRALTEIERQERAIQARASLLKHNKVA